MLLQTKMERLPLPSPPLPPRPFPSQPPPPPPSPSPALPFTAPLHSIHPPDRSSSRERSSQIPNENALFQHVCFATNHGGLTLIESTIILFAKHFCFVHTTHTSCCNHCNTMLGSAVSIYKWTIICFNKTRVFRAITNNTVIMVLQSKNRTVPKYPTIMHRFNMSVLQPTMVN